MPYLKLNRFAGVQLAVEPPMRKFVDPAWYMASKRFARGEKDWAAQATPRLPQKILPSRVHQHSSAVKESKSSVRLQSVPGTDLPVFA
jgi:hypothetical protein